MMVLGWLQRHLGRKRALEMVLTGVRLKAADALAWGLVNRVVPAAELARRKADLRARPQAREVGWLSVYQRLVRPLPEGAVLRPRGSA